MQAKPSTPKRFNREEEQGTLCLRDDPEAIGKMLPNSPEISIRLATFDQYWSLLLSVAYRMLGSLADAEDMLQETFIRWQQVPDEEIRSPRAFLVTIISRLCINHLQSARVQRAEYVGQWLPEPIITGPRNDALDYQGTGCSPHSQRLDQCGR